MNHLTRMQRENLTCVNTPLSLTVLRDHPRGEPSSACTHPLWLQLGPPAGLHGTGRSVPEEHRLLPSSNPTKVFRGGRTAKSNWALMLKCVFSEAASQTIRCVQWDTAHRLSCLAFWPMAGRTGGNGLSFTTKDSPIIERN